MIKGLSFRAILRQGVSLHFGEDCFSCFELRQYTMAWNRDHHGSRDRGRGRRDDFGGDMGFEPPRSSRAPAFERDRSPSPSSSFDRQPVVTSANVTAVVKWFNASKGFGFVAPADGTPDAFLHISALERANLSQIPEGATIVCDLGQGQRGPQVLTVHSVDESTAEAAPRAARPDRFAAQGGQTSDPTDGVVKFFSADKGFGFIQLDEGGKDVFVHIKSLERAGIRGLENGQRVRITISQGAKGPQAESVELL